MRLNLESVERFHLFPMGDLKSLPFHYLRDQLKLLWIDYHRTGSAEKAVESLIPRILAIKNAYRMAQRQVLRDKFDMEFGIAAVLTGNAEIISEFSGQALAFSPAQDKYGFYKGYTGILKGFLAGDERLLAEQRKGVEGFNPPSGQFYWPSKAVILGALDGDVKKLNAQLRNIETKFDGYALKMDAVEKNGDIDVCKLDLHFFCPYADIAFYALATKRHGPFLKRDSFWLPKDLVSYCAEHIVI
jgi:hypothetical protein